MKKRLKNGFILLFASVFIGLILLFLIFCLPINSVKKNVEASLYNMVDVRYDDDGSQFRKNLLEQKEYFTDYLMAQNAMEKVEGKSPLAHAIYIYHYDLGDDTTWLTEESLVTSVKQGTEGMYLKEYSKYWHGYLVWLKPLLMIMSWDAVEIFLVVVQILLLLAVVAISFYKKKPYVGIMVLVALAFMKPVRIWISFSMCVSFTITLIAVLLELLYFDKLEKKNWRDEFFILIGIMTAYMDFLTYPIVTLGIPLCTYVVMKAQEELHWFARIRQIFWMGACWVAGYIGMWGMKWVVAELFYQTGTLRNAVWSVIYRTSPLDGRQSFFSGAPRTWNLVMQQYDSPLYTVLFVAIVAAAVISSVWCMIKARNKNWGISLFALCVIATAPIVWLILTQNHTAIHCGFTFRIMGASVFALCSITACSLLTLRNKGNYETKKDN